MVIKEKDYILDCLKKMRDEYVGLDLTFEVDKKVIEIDALISELENNTDKGIQFREDVVEMILCYMSKFKL